MRKHKTNSKCCGDWCGCNSSMECSGGDTKKNDGEKSYSDHGEMQNSKQSDTRSLHNDLSTEYEDLQQQNIAGKRNTCFDQNCTICVKSIFADPKNQNNRNGFVCVELMLRNNQIGNYRLVKTIGKGSFSKVKLGELMHDDHNYKSDSNSNKNKVAIKIIPRNLRYNSINKESRHKRESRIYKEALITTLITHPNIVALKYFLYNSIHFYMVYEYIHGTSLLRLIKHRGRLDEPTAKYYFRQISGAISHLHGHAVVHRDLKIENILIDSANNVKIIDFNLSNYYNQDQLLNTFCGSLQFAAPELLNGILYTGPEIDIWSLGVILYVMISGTLPFDHKDISILHSKIKKGKFHFKKTVTDSVRSLINHMIENDVKKRYTIKDVLQSDWMKDENSTATRSASNDDKVATDNSLNHSKIIHNSVSNKYSINNKNALTSHNTTINHSYLTILKSITNDSFNHISSTPNGNIHINPSSKMYFLIRNIMHNKELPDYVFDHYDTNERLYRFIQVINENKEVECYSGGINDRCKCNDKDNTVVKSIKCSNDYNNCNGDCNGKSSNDCNGENISVDTKKTINNAINNTNTINNNNNHINNINNSLSTIINKFITIHNIIINTNQDQYNCLLQLNGVYVKFKLSFYFNLMINKYFIRIRKEEGCELLFNNVIEWLRDVLREYNRG